VTIEASLFTALGSLVSNRVYPITFPLTGAVPVWPAIRYSFISVTPSITICGDGGDETADTRIQIDIVATTFSAVRTLRSQVMTAMLTFSPPAVFENSFSSYDEQTKTFREQIDFVTYASSPFTT
jgi:hypothetical protein